MSGNGTAQEWLSVSDDATSDLSSDKLEEIVKTTLQTIEGDFAPSDLRVMTDLASISSEIKAVRMEIASTRPDEISDRHIPTATDELDAIVQATEDATNGIMAAAETIEGIAETVGGEHGATLEQAVTGIYEACSFQDITGQRIAKVVGTLHHIEQTISGLVASFADEIAEYKAANPTPDGESDKTDADLLNGPQLSESAQSQDEIDALLASFD